MRTFVLQQVLVLLHELLRAQPVVLVEEVDSQQVVVVLVEGAADEQRVDHGEEVPHVPEAEVGRERVVVVGVEPEVAQHSQPEQRVVGVVHHGEGHDVVPLGVQRVQRDGPHGERGRQLRGRDHQLHHLLHALVPLQPRVLVRRQVAVPRAHQQSEQSVIIH